MELDDKSSPLGSSNKKMHSGVSFWTFPLQSQGHPANEPNSQDMKAETLDAILHSKALTKKLQSLRVGSALHRKNLYQKRLRRTLPWTWLSDLKAPSSHSVTDPYEKPRSHLERRFVDASSTCDYSSLAERKAAVNQEGTNQLQRHFLMPYVIAGYLQLLFNVVIVAVLLVSLLSIVWSIRNDITGKVMEQTIEAQAIVRRCYNEYMDNRCNETQSLPLLRQQCHTWYVCMTRDPKSIGSKTKLYAETLSEVLNSFVEPISYRTLSVILLLLLGFTLVSNLAFHFAKKKSPNPFEYKMIAPYRQHSSPIRGDQKDDHLTREKSD